MALNMTMPSPGHMHTHAHTHTTQVNLFAVRLRKSNLYHNATCAFCYYITTCSHFSDVITVARKLIIQHADYFAK